MRFFSLLIVFLLSSTMVFAQKVFTDKVQEKSKNGGVVTIVQDDSLTHAVNHGTTAYGEGINYEQTDSVLIASAKKSSASRNNSGGKNTASASKGSNKTLTVDKTKKATGYRVQVYAGTGADGKKNAQATAAKCRRAIPGIPVYVSFVQPRWVCLVGDFTNRSDADVVAGKLRGSRLSNGQVMVVRTNVFRAK